MKIFYKSNFLLKYSINYKVIYFVDFVVFNIIFLSLINGCSEG
jgi:hypothetical protein